MEQKKDTTLAAQKVRIRIQSFEYGTLDSSVKMIVDTALRAGLKVAGPVPLPTTIKKYTVNRSTFVHKDSREQFEMRLHTRIIDILEPTQNVMEELTSLDLPVGVNVGVKVLN